MSEVIPDEAIEAAAKAFVEHGTLLPALEAAAPHLTRAAQEQAWDEGYLAMVDDAFRDRELVKKGSRLADDAATSNPYKKDEATK